MTVRGVCVLITAFADRFRHQALEAAWGPTKKPLAGRKRLKVVNSGRPIAAGTTIEMVVEGDKVFIVENRKENLLTEDLVAKPKVRDTWLPQMVMQRLGYSSPSSAATKRSAPNGRSGSNNDDDSTSSGGEDSSSAPGTGTSTPTTKVSKPKGPGKGVMGDGKVGGRRRKTVQARPASSGGKA
jgi:DnaJ family protein C protein 1